MIGGQNKSTVRETASEWLVHSHSGEMTDSETAALTQWLTEDPAHQHEYQNLQRLWQGLSKEETFRPYLNSPEKKRRFWLSDRTVWQGSFAAAALVLVAVILFRIVPAEPPQKIPAPLVYATETSEIQDIKLTDGSQITLSAGSKATIDFTEDFRRVTLDQGQAIFAVAKNPARPFLIAAGGAYLRVLGTTFDVRRGAEETTVSVLEGIVQVAHESLDHSVPKDTIALTAGQKISSVAQKFTALEQIDRDNFAPWRSGRLKYINVPLREIIADMNRYYAGQIRFKDTTAGDRTVTISFRTNEIDRVIENIFPPLGLKATRVEHQDIVISQAE